MEVVVFDNLKWAKDTEILKYIGNEILYYSNKIIKINPFNFSQDRFLVLTDESLYNFHKKKLKRKLEYNKIRGITLSKISPELFVVHGHDIEHDYYFQSQERNLIINLIAKFYEEQSGKQIKICEVNEKTLKNFVTGKKEKKKDVTNSKMDESKIIDTKKFLEEIRVIEKKIKPNKNIEGGNIFENKKIEDEKPINIKTNIIFCKDQSLENSELENFKIIKILGRGEYGKVFLVRFNNSDKYYAMKALKKEFLIDKNEINTVIINKQMIQKLDYEYLIGCVACFQTDERIYFILKLIEGENLSNYILNNRSSSEDQIKFFIAVIGLTIDYLHKNGISYINLRPNDIIIQKDGYIKISEIKFNILFKLKSNCEINKETCEYLSPEILNSKENTKDADWWTLGIIMYELIYSFPPFCGESDNKIKELIEKFELKFPKDDTINKNAKDLISKLLNKNPEKRLGHMKGFEEIKNHEFFKGFNFDDLENKNIKNLYTPKVGNIITDKEKKIEVSYDDLVKSKIIKIN